MAGVDNGAGEGKGVLGGPGFRIEGAVLACEGGKVPFPAAAAAAAAAAGLFLIAPEAGALPGGMFDTGVAGYKGYHEDLH